MIGQSSNTISDNGLGAAILLAARCAGIGLVFEANRAHMQVFEASVSPVPAANTLVAGLVPYAGQIETVFRLTGASKIPNSPAPLLLLEAGRKRAVLLLDEPPGIPGQLRPIQAAAFDSVGPYVLNCYEDVTAKQGGQRLWSVSVLNLIDYLASGGAASNQRVVHAA